MQSGYSIKHLRSLVNSNAHWTTLKCTVAHTSLRQSFPVQNPSVSKKTSAESKKHRLERGSKFFSVTETDVNWACLPLADQWKEKQYESWRVRTVVLTTRPANAAVLSGTHPVPCKVSASSLARCLSVLHSVHTLKAEIEEVVYEYLVYSPLCLVFLLHCI